MNPIVFKLQFPQNMVKPQYCDKNILHWLVGINSSAHRNKGLDFNSVNGLLGRSRTRCDCQLNHSLYCGKCTNVVFTHLEAHPLNALHLLKKLLSGYPTDRWPSTQNKLFIPICWFYKSCGGYFFKSYCIIGVEPTVLHMQYLLF